MIILKLSEWRKKDRKDNDDVPCIDPTVVFENPETTYLESQVTIGAGTKIEPNVYIAGLTRIGKNCEIQCGSRIINSILEDGVKVYGARIEQSKIGSKAEIGFNAQLKRTEFGEDSKMLHFGYLGDCTVGKRVNIGAGTITANYDGSKEKKKTVIGDDVFIGSGAKLIAPITIPHCVIIAGGTTLPANFYMQPHNLVVARAIPHISKSKKVHRTKDGWILEKIPDAPFKALRKKYCSPPHKI